ncbi:response regulator [Kineosporia babensis]|uniref:Response regulator transcription factor n=1 Tax=Kineosporia babensis TaxID=499548 RepID=A0A9X1NCE6_9ACTN|nr:response regulator transcription factor [Kineosporia babensis]MCD5310701.1 response regulator transcription factor [Kineosporia babensis]
MRPQDPEARQPTPPHPGTERLTRVLLVDDQPFARAAVRWLLSGAPDLVVVGEAGDGPQALRLCAELDPDVVVLDLGLPGMSGHRVAWQLRTSSTQCPAILALTGLAPERSAAQALQAGVTGYALKDSPEHLVAAVRAVARGRAWLDPAATPASEFPFPHIPSPRAGEAHHRWIVTFRIEGLLGHRDPVQAELRRALLTVAAKAVADTQLIWASLDIRDEPEGLCLLIPADVQPVRLAGPLLGNLENALAEIAIRFTPATRLRIRMSLHHGLVIADQAGWTGGALGMSQRLAEAVALQNALRRTPGQLLAVLASDDFHRTVLAPGHRSVRSEHFHPVELGPGERGWLYETTSEEPQTFTSALAPPKPSREAENT